MSVFVLVVVGFFGLSTQVEAATTAKSLTNLGIVAWWPMNEGTSTIAHDISGNSRNATLTNISAPATASSGWTVGKRGEAIRFDGTDDYLNIGTFPTLTNGTISAWIKRSGTAGTYQMIFTDSGSKLELTYSSNQLQFYVNNVGLPYNGAASLDTWYHIVGTFDSVNGTKLYVNGALVNSGAYPGSAGTATKYIGGRGVGFPFNGTIDDLRVYDHELSATEVSALYRSGEAVRKTASQSGLVAWWKFDEGTSTKATDYSGNGYTATFVGSPSWASGKFGGSVSTGNTSSDYVSNPNVTLGSIWSISSWFKYPLSSLPSTWNTLFRSSGAGNDHQVIVRRSDMNLGMYDNNTATNFRTTGFVMSTLSTGWHHLAVTGSGGTQNFYVDGVYVGQTDKQSTGNINAIGNYQSGSQNWGSFDDIRVYDRVLSTSEITTLYRESAVTINHAQNNRITDGLVGYWSFNGRDMNWTGANVGIAYDRSGNGNNGTLTNMGQATSTTSGRVGQALSFNGSNNYVQIPYSAALAPTTAISFGGWMKTTDKTLSQKIISKTETGGYAMVINEGTGGCNSTSIGAFVGVLVTGVNTYYGACYDRANITNNKWHYVMATYDSETIRLYFDGVEVNSNTAPTGPINYSTNNTLCVGTEPGGTCGITQFFSGSVDEVRVYNRALSASEIKQLYLMGK